MNLDEALACLAHSLQRQEAWEHQVAHSRCLSQTSAYYVRTFFSSDDFAQAQWDAVFGYGDGWDRSRLDGLAMLQQMLDAGLFHHATVRPRDGLCVYYRDANGFRGFSLALIFSEGSTEHDAAFAMLRGTGVSVGAYGHG